MRTTRTRARAASLLRRGRTPAASADRWRTYLSEVEPALASAPRVHRFAQPPVLGAPDLEPAPVAVWINGDGEPGSRTRAALAGSSRAPARVLEGPLDQALSAVRCEHVMLLRAGDVPAPLAVERLGQAVTLAPDADVITCDDDLLDRAGGRGAPRLRPGPSPDRWLAHDDSGPLLLVRREAAQAELRQLSGEPAWRHELALALAGAGGERHAHLPLLLCHRGADVRDPPPLSAKAVQRVLRRWEATAWVQERDGLRHVRRRPAGEPGVEVIICFRDKPTLLARALVSLLARSTYERLSVALVDNGSQEPETLELVAGMERQPRVRVIRDERPFNFAAINNLAGLSSDAEVLVFLNNDTEVLHGAWIETMLEEATRPEVGAVAPVLVYPDGSVQHAGAALGLHGYAGHPFAGLSTSAATPFGYAAQGTRNWLAVTAACLMVERRKFAAVDGFDEGFVVAGNDVDLCLRLTAAGFRSLCTPWTTLLHDESRSRGAHIDPGDFVASQRSYGEFRTVGDPFYNPNLTLSATDCSLRTPGEATA